MEKLKEQWKEVLDKTEFISIATTGDDGAHTVGTWGNYVKKLDSEGAEIRIPAYGYHKTEKNLKKNSSIELLIASKNVKRPSGKLGQGCLLLGKGEIQTSGNQAELTKTKFPGSRGVLIITSLLKNSYLSLRAPKGAWQSLYCQRFLRLLRHSIHSNDIYQQPLTVEKVKYIYND